MDQQSSWGQQLGHCHPTAFWSGQKIKSRRMSAPLFEELDGLATRLMRAKADTAATAAQLAEARRDKERALESAIGDMSTLAADSAHCSHVCETVLRLKNNPAGGARLTEEG